MNQNHTKEISHYLKNGENNSSSNYFIYHSFKPLQSPKKSVKKILPQIGSQQLWQKKKELSKEEFLKNYLIKKRKKTMIISKYLDDDYKQRLEKVKNTFKIIENHKLKNESEIIKDHYDYLEPSLVLINESINSSSTNSITSSHFNNNFRRRIFDYNKSKGLTFKSACENIDEDLQSKSIRFGSTLSKDGQFALLKSLEDQILQEIQLIYPDYDYNDIPRLSTASYKQITNDEYNPKLTEEEIMEYKQNITKCIESAMEILDDLQLKKRMIQRSKTDFDISFKIDNDITVEDLDSEYLSIRQSRMRDVTYGSLSSKTTTSIDPISRYSDWCNQWIVQLDSI